jgi:hypothetical protein
MTLNSPEPPPKPNDGTPIWRLVMSDMEQRDKDGTAKYGTPLQTFNGRKPLVDLYQEMLDACVYIRQEIEERKALNQNLVALLDHVKEGSDNEFDPECMACVKLVSALVKSSLQE